MKSLTTLILVLLAGPALPVGDETAAPAATDCAEGMLWAEAAAACTAPHDARLDDDARYRAAQDLALGGRYDDALAILATARDPHDPRILTYQGFASRKLGRFDAGLAFYRDALATDPDHFEARSYLGQTLLETGDTDGALLQLREIRDRGGRETWAYMALKQALAQKQGY